MREVELIPDAKTRKALFSLYVDGVKKVSYRVNPENRKQQFQIARETGESVETILTWFDATFHGSTPSIKKFLLVEPAAAQDVLYTRPFSSPRAEGKAHPAPDLPSVLMAALPGMSEDELVEWDAPALDRLAMLDIDYHDAATRPPAEYVESLATTRLTPTPMVWHLSRSGGVHAFYRAIGDFTAHEVASLAALVWKSCDPGAGVEIKKVGRGPGDKKLHVGVGAGDISRAAVSWLNAGAIDGDDESVASWVEAEGLEMGHRYSHASCPIDPNGGDPAGDPVTVNEAGIYCHRCSAKGLSKAGCKPGFVPWGVLVGGYNTSTLRRMVANLTHWGHARWVIEATVGMRGPIAKACYSAALKAFHGGTDKKFLIPRVFDADLEYIVRIRGWWGVVEQGINWDAKNINPVLSSLPACCDVNREGEIKSNQTRVATFKLDSLELDDYGYQDVQVLRGLRMVGQYFDPNRLVVAAPPNWLRRFGPTFYPRYVPVAKRMGLDAAKGLLEGTFPGIHWQYTTALILARACNEARVGLPQHLLVTGVSQAGKSAHVQLAAGILGDVVSNPTFAADSDRFRAAVRDASAIGSFVVCDEFLKDALRTGRGLSAEQVMDPLLNFTPDSMSHKLYNGPVKLGHIGVCVWTETWVPESLKNHTQIARRVHYLKMVKQVDWEGPQARHRISSIQEIRTIDQGHADACNAIISWVMDEYLGEPIPFERQMVRLGVSTLQKSPEFEDPTEKLLELFRLVEAAGPMDPITQKIHPGRGYKVIDLDNADSDLVTLWLALADGPGAARVTSRQVAEKDWGKVLSAPHEIHCDLHNREGSKVIIRFRIGSLKNPDRVNGEINELRKKPEILVGSG